MHAFHLISYKYKFISGFLIADNFQRNLYGSIKIHGKEIIFETGL